MIFVVAHSEVVGRRILAHGAKDALHINVERDSLPIEFYITLDVVMPDVASVGHGALQSKFYAFGAMLRL